MLQFSSNEQILHKHVKNEENRDFYTDFIWICGYTDLYRFLIFEKTDFYRNHLATLIHTPGNPPTLSTCFYIIPLECVTGLNRTYEH